MLYHKECTIQIFTMCLGNNLKIACPKKDKVFFFPPEKKCGETYSIQNVSDTI